MHLFVDGSRDDALEVDVAGYRRHLRRLGLNRHGRSFADGMHKAGGWLVSKLSLSSGVMDGGQPLVIESRVLKEDVPICIDVMNNMCLLSNLFGYGIR